MVDAPECVKLASIELRQNMTQAELTLWEAVRNRRFKNLKFRRQVAFKRFILDFFCASLKLVIEIDGGIHELQKAKDFERDTILKEYGLRVLHIPNEVVLNNVEEALGIIDEFLQR